MTEAKYKLRVPRTRKGSVQLLVGTRKGAFRIKSDAARKTWKVMSTWFLGSVVHHLVEDPRRKGYLLCAARTRDLGPTIFRSEDGGKNWKEATMLFFTLVLALSSWSFRGIGESLIGQVSHS